LAGLLDGGYLICGSFVQRGFLLSVSAGAMRVTLLLALALFAFLALALFALVVGRAVRCRRTRTAAAMMALRRARVAAAVGFATGFAFVGGLVRPWGAGRPRFTLRTGNAAGTFAPFDAFGTFDAGHAFGASFDHRPAAAGAFEPSGAGIPVLKSGRILAFAGSFFSFVAFGGRRRFAAAARRQIDQADEHGDASDGDQAALFGIETTPPIACFFADRRSALRWFGHQRLTPAGGSFEATRGGPGIAPELALLFIISGALPALMTAASTLSGLFRSDGVRQI
jgi:hypothetical protein